MKRKLLIESSCALAAVRRDWEPELSNQIPPQGKTCAYYKSQYLRMEFFRLWIITGIQVYFEARNIGDITKALDRFSEGYGRAPKTVLKWAAMYLQRILADPASEPIEQFGMQVLDLALTYDKTIAKSVSAKTGCKKGEVHIELEGHATLRELLRDFYKRFTAEDHTCKVAELVGTAQGRRGQVNVIRKTPPDALVDCPTYKARASYKKLRENLIQFLVKRKPPNCRSCYRIGDILIALEQPPRHILYHTDHSFSALCPLLGKRHQRIMKRGPPAKPAA